MRIATLINICCAFLLAGCNDRLESEKGLKVRFEIKNFQDKMGACDQPNGACAQIDMVYPQVAEGVPKIKQSINDSVYNCLIQNLVFEQYLGGLTEADLSNASKKFLQEWKLANTEMPDNQSNASWEVNVTGEVGLHTPKVATITIGSYSYAGGAHPNSFVSVFNFDLKTGKSLTWSDIITDQKALESLARKAFLKARELPSDADLTAEGYFWGDPFSLPKNFELQAEGIYFWYNPFEVAAYALGPTDFVISYAELGDLVKKEVIF